MEKQTKEQLLQLKKEALQEQYKAVLGEDADAALTKEQLADAIVAAYPSEEDPEQNNGEGEGNEGGNAPEGDKPADTATVEPTASTIGTESLVASSERLGTPIEEVDVNVGLTHVKISYPESFEGPKYFEDGATPFVAPEVAEQFVKAGIATII